MTQDVYTYHSDGSYTIDTDYGYEFYDREVNPTYSQQTISGYETQIYYEYDSSGNLISEAIWDGVYE